MKTRIWFRMAMMGFIIALSLGAGLVQAKPVELNTTTTKHTHWWYKDYIDQSGNVGTHASIAIDPGTGIPWISYYDGGNTALKVAHYKGSGGNCGVNNKWLCETVDNNGNIGAYSSIDVYSKTGPPTPNNWKVGVAYYDYSNDSLKFAEYRCNPACVWNIVTVEEVGFPSSFVGQYASMKYNKDGIARISYNNDYLDDVFSDDELKYASQVTTGGGCSDSNLWECYMVDSGLNMGLYTSLGYSSYTGKTFIAYYNGDWHDLNYAYHVGTGGNCGSWNNWQCEYIELAGDVGKFVSIHVPKSADDNLQFAYYDATHGKLKYAREVNVGDGNCGPANNFQCDFIDNMGIGFSQAGISMAVDNNNYPMVAYMKKYPALLVPPTLKIAQPVDAPGAFEGNCGPGSPSSWRCTTIDSGSEDKQKAEYASIAMNSAGLATIAYSELNTSSDPHVYSLKVAYQRDMIFLPMVMK